MSSDPLSTDPALWQQRFESILCQAPFAGLKAIFECLPVAREALYAGITGTDSYEKLLAQLGHKLVMAKQIHVQDCYTRMGPKGDIKAVLPYYDIASQSSLPTVLNLDDTVMTTPKAVAFFDAQLRELKQRLHTQPSTNH